MDFVNETGIKYFITNFKKWVMKYFSIWWSGLKITHKYVDSDDWTFNLSTYENTDSKTKGQVTYMPSLEIGSTDWRKTKWVKKEDSTLFPFSIAPSNNMVSDTKYESMYVPAVTVKPAFGDIVTPGIVTAAKFRDSLKSGNILLADGSSKKVSELSSQNVSQTNVKIANCFNGTTIRTAIYTITNDQYNLLNGWGLGYDLNFFKTQDNIIFQRCSREYSSDKGWQNARFYGYYLKDGTTLIKIIMTLSNTDIRFSPDNSSGAIECGALSI